MKLNKKFIFTFPLALISFQIFLGIISGYFFGKIFAGNKTGRQGEIKSIIFKIGNYKLHLHHWLLSLGVLIFNFLTDFTLPFSQFSLSFLGGLAIQGVVCYPDWHKILVKIKKRNFR